jgi:rubrerythrin
MSDEEQWQCRACGHSWMVMDDPDGEFTGWL